MKVKHRWIKRALTVSGVIAFLGIAAWIVFSFYLAPKLSEKFFSLFSPTKTIQTQLPPCRESPSSAVNLGSPYRLSSLPAEFTTTGGEIFITARRFEHGGIFDPEKGITAIYIGHAETPPSWDRQRNVVSNTLEELYINEGEYAKVTLPAGRYWLWTTTGGDIQLISCRPNALTDPLRR